MTTRSMGTIKGDTKIIRETVDNKVSNARNCKDAILVKQAEEEKSAGKSYPQRQIVWCPTGKNIFERFDLDEALGSGTYATTYMCIEKATGLKYACKVIEKEKLITQHDTTNVRFEISIMTRLREHQNIIKFVDAYEDSQKVYLVMELCEGETLFEEVLRRKNYNEHDASAVLKEIAQAVKHCHEQGIIHRDLKLENILYVSKEKTTIKVIDFGLSKNFTAGQKFGRIVGSLEYMAPEILMGQHGQEVDIWSLGVILYILLSGRHPFQGETDRKIAEAIMNKVIDFKGDQYWKDISFEAKDLVRGMLNRDPQKRLTVQQVLDHPWFVKHGA